MATPANYANVRRHLAKKFTLSVTSTGRRAGQRWSEGVQVRSSHFSGVIVDYVESYTALYSDGSLRAKKLAEVREHLAGKFEVTDYYGDRLSVRTKG